MKIKLFAVICFFYIRNDSCCFLSLCTANYLITKNNGFTNKPIFFWIRNQYQKMQQNEVLKYSFSLEKIYLWKSLALDDICKLVNEGQQNIYNGYKSPLDICIENEAIIVQSNIHVTKYTPSWINLNSFYFLLHNFLLDEKNNLGKMHHTNFANGICQLSLWIWHS